MKLRAISPFTTLSRRYLLLDMEIALLCEMLPLRPPMGSKEYPVPSAARSWLVRFDFGWCARGLEVISIGAGILLNVGSGVDVPVRGGVGCSWGGSGVERGVGW